MSSKSYFNPRLWHLACSAAVMSAATAFADVRYWADGNADSASLAAFASWDPAPDAAFGAGDTLVLNKGTGKIATLAADESVSVANLYVGWGTLDGGTTMNADYDLGGRLDVFGGTLSLSGAFNLGAGYSDFSNNVVNVTGGKISADTLMMGDCATWSGNRETLNISGAGVFEVLSGANLAKYGGGNAYVNVFNG